MLFYALVYLAVIFLAVFSDMLTSSSFRQNSAAGSNKLVIWVKEHAKLLSIILLCISALILILVRGLRYGIGIDAFHSYLWKFNAAIKGNVVWGDPVYAIFIKFCALVSPNPTVFYLLDSILFVSVVYLAIAQCNIDGKRFVFVVLFCASYHYLRSFNLQAQYLAMAFCLLAYVMVQIRGKWVLGLIASALALGIHSSSIVVIVPIWAIHLISRKILSNRIALLISLAIPILAVLCRGILPSIVELLLSNSRFASYIGSKYDVGGFSKYLFVLNLAIYVLYAAPFTFTSLIGKKEICSDGLILQSFALAATLVFGVIPLMDRITYYFMFFQIITLPYLISNLCSERMQINCAIAVIISLFVLQFVYLIPKDSDHIDPYVSIYSDEQTKIEAINEPTGQ